MKKNLLLIATMLVLPVTFMGCATSGDLERMQAQQKLIDAHCRMRKLPRLPPMRPR